MMRFAVDDSAQLGVTANFSQDTWWLWVLKAVFLVVFLILSVIMALWVERRVIARMQYRSGPNVLGPLGLFQALADAAKLMLKEDFWLKGADKFMYFLGPVISAFCAFSVYAVIPMGPNVNIFGHSTPLQLTDSPVAVLYILAIAALGVYGLVIGGWSANSNFSLLGAVRSSAQVISYELAMSLSLVTVFLIAGSMSTSTIVHAQSNMWYVVTLLPSFLLYLISMNGEVNRLPFDLPEAEGEIVAGHMTEYSSMKFGWFYLSEYINMLNVSAVAVTLFLGGWQADPLTSRLFALVGWNANSGWWPMLWFIIKLWLLMFWLVWVRATLMRLRYDHFMKFGWKFLMPVGLAWFVAVATIQGLRSFWNVNLQVLLIGISIFFLAIMLVLLLWPVKKIDEEKAVQKLKERGVSVVRPGEAFDAFADGYPVPPLPGQVLPPSPRSRVQRVSVPAEITKEDSGE